MVELSFNPAISNYLIYGEQRFFLIALSSTDQGLLVLVPDNCPHRGGPLHLGCLRENQIICPWHNTPTPNEHLLQHAIPLACPIKDSNSCEDEEELLVAILPELPKPQVNQIIFQKRILLVTSIS